MALQKLPKDIQSLFCASLQICSYKKAIEELVYNSLDANSTSIAIRVNIDGNSIQVIDNGSGISKSDFTLLGEKHATSKCVDLSSLKSAPNKYGFRGLSLASIIEVSRNTTITSRFQNAEETWTKSFHKGKEKKCCQTSKRPSKGTTVELKGFLHNLNIQRKAIDSLNELNNIKIFLEQLSLVHNNISLSLRDDSKNEIIFELHKNRDIYQTLRSMFGINKKDIQELKVEKNEYKVTAYIGKMDKELDLKHWIYLNGKLLQNSKIHKIVNDKLEKALKLNCKNIKKTKSKHDYYSQQENFFQKNKIPTYFIFISCPYYDYDVNYSAKQTMVEFKNWEQINKLLEKLAKFYAGDVNLKEIKPVINKVDTVKKVEDTRDQVKKIMEKILESHPKKLGISQMQKGIKGKLVKRKDKKKQNLTLSKIILNKNAKNDDGLPKAAEIDHDMPEIHKLPSDTNNPKTKSKIEDHGKKESNRNKVTTTNNKKQLNPKIKKVHNSKIKDKKENGHRKKDASIEIVKKPSNNKQIKNDIMVDVRTKQRKIKLDNRKPKSHKPTTCAKKIHKIKKNVQDVSKNFKNKTKQKMDAVLKKFNEDPTGSINKRCNMLQQKVDDLMSYKKKRKRKIFINETVQYSNVVRNNKNYSIRKKVGKIVIHDYVPLPPKFSPCSFDDRVWDKVEKKSHKSSYDLVKTILRTQETIEERRHLTPNKDSQLSTFSNLPNYISPEPGYIEYNEIPLKTNLRPRETIEERELIAPSEDTHLSTLPNLMNDISAKPRYTELNETPRMPRLTKLTFESHNYDRERIGHRGSHNYDIMESDENLRKNSNCMHFISTNSRENFKIPARQIQRKSYRSKQFTFHNNRLQEKKTNQLKLFKNLYDVEESSYSIEFSKTNSMQEYHFHNPETNVLQDLNVQQVDDGTYSIDQNDNNQSYRFGSTYTVDINGPNNNIATQNLTNIQVHKNRQEINKTDDTINRQNSQYFKNNILAENDQNDIYSHCDENNMNIVFISKSQEQDANIEESLERHVNPLEVCETIQSNDGSEESASKHRKFNDSLFNGDFDVDSFLCDRNAYSESQAIGEEMDFRLNGDEIFDEKDMNALNTELSYNINFSPRNETIMSQVLDMCNDDEFRNRKENQVNDDNNFKFKTRLRFVPKGMSQIFQNCQTKNVGDYNLVNDYFEEEIYNNFVKDVEILSKIFEPNIENVKEITTKAIDKMNNKLNKDNASLIFSGESLKQAKVFGQIDKKFIAARISGSSQQSLEPSEYLVLFDQHAVHERILLENNLKDYLIEDQWKSIALDGININVSKDVTMYLHNYEEKFAQLGLQWIILNDGKVSINAIPEAILGKNPRQVDIVIRAVKNLISEEISCIKTQKGCISLYPKAIMDLVFSESCRYAIKFGDKLSTKECEELLNALSECKTPFQCAHGRPVMAVLMNIKSTKRVYKVDLINGNKWRNIQKR